MNWQKLDTGLAAALSEKRQGNFDVFIRFGLPLNERAIETLAQVGISRTVPFREIITARIQAAIIERLSELSFVRSISLARLAKPLSGYQKHPGSLWLDDNRDNLPNNEWAAAGKDGLVATDPTIDGLNKKVTELGVRLEDICIAFITHNSI